MSDETREKGARTPGRKEEPRKAAPRRQDEAKLDRAIKGSFPASDPIATGQSTGDDDSPRGRVDRKTPPIDHGLVERLAKDVRRDSDTE